MVKKIKNKPKAVPPQPAQAPVTQDIWLRWNEELFNASAATRYSLVVDSVYVYFGSDFLVLNAADHPHVQEMLESDTTLSGSVGPVVLGMIQNAILQGGAGTIDLHHLVGTLERQEQITQEVEPVNTEELSPEEAAETVNRTLEAVPEDTPNPVEQEGPGVPA